ncbi:hypothetical protein GCM10022247_11410 [Allokutzneria multivorans]|uniref:Uncharacterized protein n=1 Tax=Allokutzneria multivorans TaxID=1142134 RepID=A0ABP7R7U2_9PSEU
MLEDRRTTLAECYEGRKHRAETEGTRRRRRRCEERDAAGTESCGTECGGERTVRMAEAKARRGGRGGFGAVEDRFGGGSVYLKTGEPPWRSAARGRGARAGGGVRAGGGERGAGLCVGVTPMPRLVR